MVDGRGNRYSFGYSKADQQVTQTDSLLRVQTVTFDAASQPVVRIDARSFRVSQVFDNAGQLVGIRYPDSSRVTQAFDQVANRRVLRDTTGSYTTTFDSLNRAHAVENPALKTVTVTWDGGGRRHTLTNPDGGIVTYSFDKRDECVALQNADGDRTSWTFDPAGRQTVQLLGNGVRVSLAYDAADRLVRLANLNSSGVTISSFRDTWDNANNRVSRVEADGTRVSWSYDASYQLTRERRSGMTSAYDTTYSYDRAGNRVRKLDSGSRTTITLDVANQLVKSVAAAGTTTFSFDANGNQRLQIAPAGGGTTTNTWDFENRLTKVQLGSGVVNTFTFSGDGQRVQTQDSSGTLKQIYDGPKVLLETDQTNTTQAVYTSSPGMYGDLVSQKRLLVPHYHVFDPLGSTDRLVSAAQAVTDTYIYKAFGEIPLTGTTVNPFRYVGSLGYYFNRDTADFHISVRRYLAALGRFASADPTGLLADADLFGYCGNSPMSSADPSGLMKITATRAKLTLCGGTEFSATYTPYNPRGVEIRGKVILVQEVCDQCHIADCLNDPQSSCFCGPPKDRQISNPFCFYEAWILKAYDVVKGRAFVKDDIKLRRQSLPWGCPNTKGSRGNTHILRLFTADKARLKEFGLKFIHDHVNSPCARIETSPASLGAPSFWNDSETTIDSGGFAYVVNWDCCSRCIACQWFIISTDPEQENGGCYRVNQNPK